MIMIALITVGGAIHQLLVVHQNELAIF